MRTNLCKRPELKISYLSTNSVFPKRRGWSAAQQTPVAFIQLSNTLGSKKAFAAVLLNTITSSLGPNYLTNAWFKQKIFSPSQFSRPAVLPQVINILCSPCSSASLFFMLKSSLSKTLSQVVWWTVLHKIMFLIVFQLVCICSRRTVYCKSNDTLQCLGRIKAKLLCKFAPREERVCWTTFSQSLFSLVLWEIYWWTYISNMKKQQALFLQRIQICYADRKIKDTLIILTVFIILLSQTSVELILIC